MEAGSQAQVGSYRVEVIRSGDWWSITVPALDGVFSQAKRLDQVEARISEAIALMLDIDEGDVCSLDVVVTPPERVADLLTTLEDSVSAADEATRTAMSVQREVAELLRAEGLPMRDVGEFLGVSHQRVSQLLAS